ncbi:MAG: glutathione S-transferase family protein [Proteobacteria bacterium]|nr:glutathione S-transferase family protein [Pseudomonadota bacterium]
MTLPQPVRLYDQPRAPNPRRVNIFLAEKGVEIERVNIDLMAGEHKQPDYLAKIGVPQVPALELDDGAIVTESVAICRYFEALRPEPNMMGRDVMEQVIIENWQRLVEFRLFATVAACFRHTNPHLAVLEDQCPDWGEVNRGRLDARLGELDRRLEGRDWIAADRLTIADITALVAVEFLRVIKHPIPEGDTNLLAWVERMRARPSTSF